jgi:hypothetical protein
MQFRPTPNDRTPAPTPTLIPPSTRQSDRESTATLASLSPMSRCYPRRIVLVALLALPAPALARSAPPGRHHRAPVRSSRRPRHPAGASFLSATGLEALDGSGNNRAHPSWGEAGTPYLRVAPADYADGAAAMTGGPAPRRISNRIFNDVGQNIFSERHASQWAWTWGQFMDHTFGLGKSGTESAPIGFDASDPLESFENDFGSMSFTRDAAAAGTGTGAGNPRQQVNTESSYIDGSSVYGNSLSRLEWLRTGPVDGDLRDNGPRLLMGAGDYLPRATARGDAASAPAMAIDGGLAGHPQDRAVAGDTRTNENMALTALQTLFAREHNRIVGELPASLPAEVRFQVARRIVAAEQQYVTYNEFLPSMGVRLAPYRGYRPNVNASLSNEFATVGYRVHSMIHGEFEIHATTGQYSAAQRATLTGMGVQFEPDPADAGRVTLVVPLNVAFFNPDLVPAIGLGPIMKGLAEESQYNNDEQFDNTLRSVLFKLPGPSAPDPAACFEDPAATGCFQGVTDLGSIDVQRGRDHGMPTYNQMRRAYGLAPERSFAAITGEASESFPADPRLNPADPADDPDSLDFTALFDSAGHRLTPGTDAAQDTAVRGVRRTPLAARLKSLYGSVDRVDAFVGMVSEPHVSGTEFGQLQLAMWKRQFEALRDGDRFFYANDPLLPAIQRRYGITYRHTLADLISLDSGVARADLAANVFFAG